MDTHVAAPPDLEPATAELSARLPGEAQAAPPSLGEGEPGERLPPSAPKPVRRRRGRLLAGVAVAALAAIGGAFGLSPYNHVYPVPRLQASVQSAASYAQDWLRPILAPAASLASVAVPAPPPATREAYAPKPHDQEVAELLSLYPGADGQGHGGQALFAGAAGPALPIAPDHPSAGPARDGAAPSEPGKPAGDVLHEPGSVVAAQASAQSAPVPGAGPATTVSTAPAAPVPKDATALIIASLSAAQLAVPPDTGQTADARATAPAGPLALRTPAPAAPQRLADAQSAAETPAQPAAAPDASQVAAAGATPLQATRTPAPVAPRRTIETQPAAEPAPTSPTPPAPDALAVAANLRAAPMTPPEQVQVLGLVTEMAAMVRELRKQQVQLRADLGRASTDTAARLTDYERRLALAEASRAVTAADDAGAGHPSPQPGNDAAVIAVKPMPVLATRAVAVVPSPALPAAPKLYRVQAASPGLALLAQVDRGGGDGAQLQVAVGDTVPDYGRVKSIGQKGTAWVVTTERGAIQ